MRKYTILCDLDEKIMRKYTILCDLDDTIFAYSKAKSEALTKYPEQAYPQSQYGFFRNLEFLPGAELAIRMLMSHPEIDFWFATAPSVKNPLSYMEKRLCIEDHFGIEMCERLIICSDKSMLKGSILIDNCASGNGQDMFDEEFIHFGSEKYPDWPTVIRTIYKLVGHPGEKYYDKQVIATQFAMKLSRK